MQLSAKLTLALLLTAAVSIGQVPIQNSVVKIFSIVQPYDYQQPWQKQSINNQTGSGFVISGNRILTNAHVVADSKFIEIRKSGSPQKYYATVSFFAPEYDLAILKLEDKSFFDGAAPLEIGDMPFAQQKVYACGFPIGGDELSVTEGVVSRIEHQIYATGKSYLQAIQIDASINPGNSGGPVLQGNKVVGVAFQGLQQGDNIGYAIPPTVIKHFLEDIEDGVFDGITHLGFNWQPLENQWQRKMIGLPANGNGIRITSITPDSPLKDIARVGDVILAIDGTDIASNGTIKYRKSERTHFVFLNHNKKYGDKIELKIFRDGKELTVSTTLSKNNEVKRLVPHDTYNHQPEHFMYGGFIFQPLNLNYLASFHPQQWRYAAPRDLVELYYSGQPTVKGEEVVILTHVLPDQINIGYHNVRNIVIYKVNGQLVENFNQFRQIIANSESDYIIFEQKNGEQLVLDRKVANKRNDYIAQSYGIAAK